MVGFERDVAYRMVFLIIKLTGELTGSFFSKGGKWAKDVHIAGKANGGWFFLLHLDRSPICYELFTCR